MHPDFDQDLAILRRSTTAQLRQRFTELFGEPPRSANKPWLIKRIAWRLQALAEGDLSARARQRARELANEADLRFSPPRPASTVGPPTLPSAMPAITPSAALDPRLPPPGTVLSRRYKGQSHEVQILTHGFGYQGRVFASLSAVAKFITGSHCSGFFFFRLDKKGAKS